MARPPFEALKRLDADPDTTRTLNEVLGISDNYYTDVPYDPPDDQLKLYIDALKGLTPRGSERVTLLLSGPFAEQSACYRTLARL